MSTTTSPIPVLRGRAGTTLQAQDDVLVLSRRRKEKRIPLQAVRRVGAEGRALAVELTAPAGTAPVTYMVRGVSEVAASAFADTVTALLPEERAADGTALVTDSAPAASDDDWYTRAFRLTAWVTGLVAVGVAVPLGIVESVSRAVAFAVFTPIAVGIAAFGVAALSMQYREWTYPRYGITVEAVRRGPKDYAYTDLHGVVRGAYISGSAPTIKVAYHPRNPADPVHAKSWIAKAAGTLVFLAIIAVGLAFLALTVSMAVDGFQRA
ncbi:hypothetical protein ACFCZV_34630 [Streptomyces hydrogenans]|uniref:hypothetical protein n=1 Tax=Streptomyces hydrogenans TaxID=1873719 RepID=UPI0035DE6E73